MMARARELRQMSETARLVTEILAGGPPQPLPPSITAALEQLRAARTPAARAVLAEQPGER